MKPTRLPNDGFYPCNYKSVEPRMLVPDLRLRELTVPLNPKA
jgi:hypothetical protein